MKERPILLKTEMVRAILDGRKTQMRRVVTSPREPYGQIDEETGQPYYVDEYGDYHRKPCPFGEVGDRLWVRETHALIGNRIEYRADDMTARWSWTPSVHMKRAYSRITLEITDVRIEALQDISRADAVSEGLIKLPASGRYVRRKGEQYLGMASNDPRDVFRMLWDSVNHKRGYAWSDNPWIWVITFRGIKP